MLQNNENNYSAFPFIETLQKFNKIPLRTRDYRKLYTVSVYLRFLVLWVEYLTKRLGGPSGTRRCSDWYIIVAASENIIKNISLMEHLRNERYR